MNKLHVFGVSYRPASSPVKMRMSQTEAELRERILNQNVEISILKSESDKKDARIEELETTVTVLTSLLDDYRNALNMYK